MSPTVIQRLAVAALLVWFTALLPAHTHAGDEGEVGHSAHAGHDRGHHDGHQSSPERCESDGHAKHDCHVCRLARSTTAVGMWNLPLIGLQPTPRVAAPVDDVRPVDASVTIPYHGRAPPIV